MMSDAISFRLDHKIALVTACSRGIGRACALALAAAGADNRGQAAPVPSLICSSPALVDPMSVPLFKASRLRSARRSWLLQTHM